MQKKEKALVQAYVLSFVLAFFCSKGSEWNIMNRIIKNFLEENQIAEIIKENFDYTIDKFSDIEQFKTEYKKFMWIYSSFFFTSGGLKTIINSYDIKLLSNDLERIFKLYRYAYDNNLIERYILGEFLLTYYSSINNSEYKTKGPGKVPVAEYRAINANYKNGKSIYMELQEITYEFYCQLVSVIIDDDEFLYDEVIDRMKTNINSESKFNYLVDKLLKNERNVLTIIERDNEIDKHADIYNNYICKEILDFTLYKYPMKIILKLDQKCHLRKETFDVVVNDIVDKVNNLQDKVEHNECDLIKDISSISNFLNQINIFIDNLHTINKIQRQKLKECRNNIMCIKRYILSDKEMIKSALQEFSYETKIDSKEIDKVVNEICSNVLRIFAHSKVDFEKELEEAIKSYSEHPLNSLVNNFTLDSNHQTYYIFNETEINDYFKVYFDELGKKYTELHADELRNKLMGGYYNELLKYLRRTFTLKQSMICDFLKSRDKFNEVLDKLRLLLKLKANNKYSIVAHNVIEIEARIIDILKEKNLTVSLEPKENLVKLAQYFMENKIAFNGLIYINYILYEESGLKIRNNIAHGNLINENLDIELIVTFSSIILLQWLYNEK